MASDQRSKRLEALAQKREQLSEKAVHDLENHADTIRKVLKILPIFGLAGSIALVWWGMQSGVLRSLESLQSFIDTLGLWGPLVFMAASFASVMFPIIPAGLLVIAAPILFGPVEGTIYNWLSVCSASIVNFIVGRQLGMPLINAFFSEKTVEKYLGWTRKPSFTTAFATAIVIPIAPDDLLCYLAGTTKMKLSTFVWIILLGKIPTLVAYGLGVAALITHFLPW